MKDVKKRLLKIAVFSAALASAFANAAASPEERSLSFDNLHTGEKISVTYWRNGQYDAAALKSMAHFLRDRLNGEQHAIAPQLFDILYAIKTDIQAQKTGLDPVFEVISGYRAADTNESFRKAGSRVAKKSQHMQGQAIDFRVNGVPLETLRDMAWCQQKGGVGYYPEAHNNFVHIDTGRVRFWPAQKTKWKCMD